MLNPDLQRQDVSNLLILPIQRVTRYVMLLSDLVKHTEPSHPDSEALSAALTNMRKLSFDVNEAKRREESMTKMFQIQKSIENCPPTIISASRRYVTEDDFFLMDGDTAVRDARLFLFTDMILLARGPPHTRFLTNSIANQSMAVIAARKTRFKFHKIIMLKRVRLVEGDVSRKPGPVFRLMDGGGEGAALQAYSASHYANFVAALQPQLAANEEVKEVKEGK